MRHWISCALVCVVVLNTASVSAGVYSGPSDTDHSIDPAIASDDPRFLGWANSIEASGTTFGPGGSTTIDELGGFNSLGDLSLSQIGAGDSPGFLTVGFEQAIGNGLGHDFAVFENGQFYSDPFLFAELAYVEISTNGNDFVRFPSLSLNTPADVQNLGAFAGIDATNVFNLAGKHRIGFGTPFDLDELSGHALVQAGEVDLNNIQYVRLVDVPGDGSFVDSEGNGILDAWQTSGGTAGFDFRLGEGIGIGVLNVSAVPEPSIALAGTLAVCSVLVCRRRRRVLSQCHP